jgi:hypothetical protein
MATAIQQKLAAAAQAKLVASIAGTATSAPEVLTSEEQAALPLRTFVHQVAGSNVIMEDGRKIVFGGKTGQGSGLGYYVTNVPEEVELLSSIARMSTSQLTELVGDREKHTEKLMYKSADPALQQSIADAAKNSERVFNPQVSAAVDNMGAHVASGMAADGNQ